jgi:hypothetical protein
VQRKQKEENNEKKAEIGRRKKIPDKINKEAEKNWDARKFNKVSPKEIPKLHCVHFQIER